MTTTIATRQPITITLSLIIERDKNGKVHAKIPVCSVHGIGSSEAEAIERAMSNIQHREDQIVFIDEQITGEGDHAEG